MHCRRETASIFSQVTATSYDSLRLAKDVMQPRRLNFMSVTGSLATILWLVALRREGEHVSAWEFLKVGAVAMPVALLAALACL